MNDTRLKRWIAATGILLPLLLIGAHREIPLSFSATYYGAGRDIFIGALAVIGGALGCMQGHDSRDRRAAFIACWAAFAVGYFPMAPDGATGWPFWQGWIHFGGALLFFGALASMCGRLFVLTDQAQMSAQKMRRNSVYRACAMVIVVGVAALAIVAISFERNPWVFAIEAVMVWAFGLAFAVKSGFLSSLNDPERTES